jgi:hypothetical protein
MAGTIPLSLTQQFDALGNVLAGGQLYLIQAGTTATPQNGYQDSALTLVLPNPITLDASGRIPQFFLADGSIKVRLTSASGVNQLTQDGILVVGASSGGGGGSTVDATTILATGDMKFRYGTGILSGFVRANARTIGSATSGGSERANADCQALFEYLWAADTNLSVSTGRGASANADWTANKALTLPDWRGRTVAGLDDMGNTAAGTLTTSLNGFGFGGAIPTRLGDGSGAESRTLTLTQLPTGITAGGTTANTIPGGKTLATYLGGSPVNVVAGGSTPVAYDTGGTSNISFVSTLSGSASVTSNNTSGGAHGILSPTRLATIYIKL